MSEDDELVQFRWLVDHKENIIMKLNLANDKLMVERDDLQSTLTQAQASIQYQGMEIYALRKQLIELQDDKVELIAQRDTWIGNADAIHKQLDEWKAAHDNLAQQLGTSNDSLELAVDAIDLLRGLAVIEVEEDINDWHKIQDIFKKLGIND